MHTCMRACNLFCTLVPTLFVMQQNDATGMASDRKKSWYALVRLEDEYLPEPCRSPWALLPAHCLAPGQPCPAAQPAAAASARC